MSDAAEPRNPREPDEPRDVLPEPPRRARELPTAPYLDAIVSYGFRGSVRFHVPGHKGGPGSDPGLRSAIGDRALALDICQDIEGIDVGPSPTPYARAEQLAAAAYGAQQTWFLTNGATQGNHALCLALAKPTDHVLVQRNSHASIVDGLVLSGGRASFVAPEYDSELGMAHGVTPEALDAALRRDPDITAAFIVSPTYYGMAADIRGCADVAHRHGAALIVDCAWGSHFGFHPALPEFPLSLGADAVLASTHKIVGSLTQSAMLHVGRAGSEGLVDADEVSRCVRLVRSTSPNSLLLASLDAARRQLSAHGEALLDRTIAAAAAAREAIDAGCGLCDRRCRAWSAVPVSPAGIRCGSSSTCAAPAAPAMSWPPSCAPPTTSTSSSPRTPRSCSSSGSASRLSRWSASPTTSPRPCACWRGPARARRSLRRRPRWSITRWCRSRDAFLGAGEAVAVDEAVGRISCESIAGYPPGVPSLLPGERVTAEVVALPARADGRRRAAARRRRPDVHDGPGARGRTIAAGPRSASSAPRPPPRLRRDREHLPGQLADVQRLAVGAEADGRSRRSR